MNRLLLLGTHDGDLQATAGRYAEVACPAGVTRARLDEGANSGGRGPRLGVARGRLTDPPGGEAFAKAGLEVTVHEVDLRALPFDTSAAVDAAVCAEPALLEAAASRLVQSDVA
jgi:hypothetical protein